jgi:hypothetical protein
VDDVQSRLQDAPQGVVERTQAGHGTAGDTLHPGVERGLGVDRPLAQE